MSNPANPMSRVFDEAELRELSHLCVERDLVVISDEVWEHIVYDGRTHHSLASFPGMWPRTIKIGSAGKLLSLTGWKVGFVCADAHFLDQIQRKHQFLTFSTPPHLQTAVGFGLRREAGEFDRERSELASSRDFLTNRLQEHGFDVLASQSTYFLYIDLAASGVTLADAEFCRLAIVEAQVVTIPLSVLYAAAPPTHLLRACFARPDEMLVEGAARLAKAREFCLGV
jgi:aspartate/methionine/tyrosine aminotransferase